MAYILIVDDQEIHRLILRTLLRDNGYQVKEAINGKEALEKARIAPPDLIISDLLMPVMDGYTLLWHWKKDEKLRSVGFIVYSATYLRQKDQQLARDLGADAFIIKPAKPESLISQIKKILASNKRREITHSDNKMLFMTYHEVLVKKLEDKMIQLRQVNQKLEKDITARRQTEEKYQLLAERLSLATSSAGIGVWEWDVINNKFNWDDQMCRLYGIKTENFDGEYDTWKKFIVPEDTEQSDGMVKAALKGKQKLTTEFRIRWPNNSVHFIAAAAKTIQDAKGHPVRMVGINYDVTKRNETESALLNAKENAEKTSTELYTYLLAIGQLALVSVADRTGCIIEVNDKFCEITGYSQKELLGQNYRILNSGTHPKSFFAEMWATINVGNTWHYEICNRKKQGQLYWVNSTIVPLKDRTGTITRFISVNVDITAHKQKEAALKERLKETNCLYAIRHDMLQQLPTKEFCERIIGHIIPAMQFPELTAVAIQLVDNKFTSENFHEGLSHGLQSKIVANNKVCGELQVFYTEHEAFLIPEEPNLIYAIANDLQLWMERKHIDDAKERSEALIWQQANFDALTGLPNRRMFQNRLEQGIKKTKRSGLPFALMLFDLDHFKQVNDTFGHGTGDVLLKDAAKRLNSCVRETDFIARLGGDEFIVILNELEKPKVVERVAHKILSKLAEPFQINNEVAYVSSSIGIAFYPENGNDIDTLLSNADQAMYASKNRGRNCFSYFTPSMQKSAQARWRLIDDLRNALSNNQFQVHYQPIVELTTGMVHKAEALIRWHHPIHGMISPTEFIPVAEETGMIVSIGDWIFHQVADHAKKWRSSCQASFQISINISPIQFHNQNCNLNTWFNHLHLLGLPGQSIELEITEGLLLDTNTNVTHQLLLLRDAGIQVSIDDFGTGYSSLSYLKKFDIDYLKIDKSFIHNLTEGSDDMALSEAIIVMAHKLGLKVIAEGIETAQQRNLLLAAGCDSGQGYFFSKPLPPQEFENLLVSVSQRLIV
jgi:diguanylate cyclase (GGDEF)-like protein/PAS domain S-box-containing protein